MNYSADIVVLTKLRLLCAEKGLRAFCRLHNLDPGNVSNILKGKKNLTRKVAAAAGYRMVVMYIEPIDPKGE